MITSIKSSTVAKDTFSIRITHSIISVTVFISYQDLAVQHFVVSENIIEHLFVQMLGRILERDFHTAGFFGFEVDVAGRIST